MGDSMKGNFPVRGWSVAWLYDGVLYTASFGSEATANEQAEKIRMTYAGLVLFVGLSSELFRRVTMELKP